MTDNKTTLAIFDFDGTLTAGHLWVGIARHHREHKINRLKLYLYLISHMPLWLAAKVKLYSVEKNRAQWGQDLPVLFKGFSRDKAQKAYQWVTDNYFLPLMRPDVLAKLNEHKRQGHKIMLLSGMFTDFLEVVGKSLGVDFVVGTRLEVINNIYSGHIIKPLCFGENKAKLFSEYLQQKKLNVDLQHSSAYADSYYDIPVFNLVGNPVAAYPDKKLLGLAQQKGWQIIGNSPPVHLGKR
jgi:HAD superfamily hydrolase (TIGR01490 family)